MRATRWTDEKLVDAIARHERHAVSYLCSASRKLDGVGMEILAVAIRHAWAAERLHGVRVEMVVERLRSSRAAA